MRGFTLVELLIVIAIISIISAVVLANYRHYDSEIILQNKAYEVALAIREAQLKSISIGTESAGGFVTNYGVRFSRISDGGANTGYQFCVYPSSGNASGATCQPLVTLSNDIIVSDVQTKDIDTATYEQRNSVDIKFVRPHLMGQIAVNGGAFDTSIGDIAVTLQSPRESTRTVYASQTGMISMQAAGEPGAPGPNVPSCSLTANPPSIIPGNSTTLSWDTQNVTEASINQGIGEVPLPDGSWPVSPASPTTYTMTVSGPGGSGVTCDVTVDYTGPYFTGGTVTESGGYRIHTFTSSGTLTMLASGTVEYLVVAGGGGGGRNTSNFPAGGGGGGGMRTGTVNVTGTQTITVGAGGSGATSSNTSGQNGGTSSIGALVSSVGGGGGGGDASGKSGGSGGGGDAGDNGGSGTSGQGRNGGSGAGAIFAGNRSGGGGGGAGAVGANGSSNNGGNGGTGTSSSISGSSVTYAAGGGGGKPSGGSAGSGGSSCGGNGGANGGSGSSGTANRGCGGGGSGGASNGGSGGSGIVIIRYLLNP